ncbi:hypothetical protein AB0M43_11530 [Longispora sp. NPDC051575]|uniref:hypothetical protein n=1 Tax=Longispora sp. NPDC051575 TaxID=3154943 RepID=UPI003422DAEB
MPLLISLVALLTVLVLLNLTLAIGLVRRLRDHDQRLATLEQGAPEPMLPLGERIDAFTAVTVDGEELTRETLAEGTMVGFFDPQCETCHSHLPLFAAEAARRGPGLALGVVREDDESHEMVAVLAPAARVVVERRRGPVARAFHVEATPAFCRLGAGQTVVAHGYGHEVATPA